MNCPDCDTPLMDGLCPHCSAIQRGDSPAAIASRVAQAQEPHDYHVGITDHERLMMEQASFNFHDMTGRRMRIPPRLYSDLKSKGVNMRWMESARELEQ